MAAQVKRDQGVFIIVAPAARVRDKQAYPAPEILRMLFDLLKAAILGIVEGLTEFLPVSSTGHLLLLGHFLGFDETGFGKTFAILIQLGAILALLSIYFLRLWRLATGFFTDPAGAPLCHRRTDRLSAGGDHRRAGAWLYQGRAVQSLDRLHDADRRRARFALRSTA